MALPFGISAGRGRDISVGTDRGVVNAVNAVSTSVGSSFDSVIVGGAILTKPASQGMLVGQNCASGICHDQVIGMSKELPEEDDVIGQGLRRDSASFLLNDWVGIGKSFDNN
jgi:hypothetical protein